MKQEKKMQDKLYKLHRKIKKAMIVRIKTLLDLGLADYLDDENALRDHAKVLRGRAESIEIYLRVKTKIDDKGWEIKHNYSTNNPKNYEVSLENAEDLTVEINENKYKVTLDVTKNTLKLEYSAKEPACKINIKPEKPVDLLEEKRAEITKNLHSLWENYTRSMYNHSSISIEALVEMDNNADKNVIDAMKYGWVVHQYTSLDTEVNKAIFVGGRNECLANRVGISNKVVYCSVCDGIDPRINWSL